VNEEALGGNERGIEKDMLKRTENRTLVNSGSKMSRCRRVIANGDRLGAASRTRSSTYRQVHGNQNWSLID